MSKELREAIARINDLVTKESEHPDPYDPDNFASGITDITGDIKLIFESYNSLASEVERLQNKNTLYENERAENSKHFDFRYTIDEDIERDRLIKRYRKRLTNMGIAIKSKIVVTNDQDLLIYLEAMEQEIKEALDGEQRAEARP